MATLGVCLQFSHQGPALGCGHLALEDSYAQKPRDNLRHQIELRGQVVVPSEARKKPNASSLAGAPQILASPRSFDNLSLPVVVLLLMVLIVVLVIVVIMLFALMATLL